MTGNLLSLSGRFVKITQDHMESVTRLQSETHINKELSDRLGAAQDQLTETQHALAEKEK